jgi:hypothetical protein
LSALAQHASPAPARNAIDEHIDEGVSAVERLEGRYECRRSWKCYPAHLLRTEVMQNSHWVGTYNAAEVAY